MYQTTRQGNGHLVQFVRMEKERISKYIHDIRTPLATMSGYAQLLKTKCVQGTNEYKWIEELYKESLVAQSLLQEFSDENQK